MEQKNSCARSKVIPPIEFFRSGGISGRLIYMENGLRAALRFFLRFLEGILPVTNINIINVSMDTGIFAPICDLDPQGQTRTRKAGFNREFFTVLKPEMLDSPMIINDLYPFRALLEKDETARLLPPLKNLSMLRLPLFKNNSFIFVMNFWSREKDNFREEDIAVLKELILPFANEIRHAFAGMTAVELVRAVPEQEDADFEFCPGLSETLKAVRKVAPTEAIVLLLGETGSGKSATAEMIHKLSPRSKAPFVTVNCGAIAPNLLETELFGAEKGAFTGADRMRYGFFEFATGGTLFLDEIGELPLNCQAQLLHALEKRIIRRVGSPRLIPIDVRIIAATNRDLEAMVASRLFRSDLYYRLSVYPISIPPLRKRREDILPLARRLVKTRARAMNLKISADILKIEAAMLVAHDWPGNVRELINVIDRALINNEENMPLHFELAIKKEEQGLLLDNDWPALNELQDRYIGRVLEKTDGNLAQAAKILGIHYTTLHARVKKFRKGRLPAVLSETAATRSAKTA